MTIYTLTYTDASSSLSTEDEFVDDILLTTNSIDKLNAYIADRNIDLGKNFLYDLNYEFYTVHETKLVED
jgi:hypothetical protein